MLNERGCGPEEKEEEGDSERFSSRLTHTQFNLHGGPGFTLLITDICTFSDRRDGQRTAVARNIADRRTCSWTKLKIEKSIKGPDRFLSRSRRPQFPGCLNRVFC